MITVSHRIAGITFRTESNVWLPRLQDEPYAQFQVGNEGAFDVHHRLHRVDSDSLTLTPLIGGERDHLLQDVHSAPDALDSPLLRSPAVRARLRARLDQPHQIDVWLYQDRVLVHDFSCNVSDFFYVDAYGEYRGPFAPLRNGYEIPADSRPWFHRVDSDSLTLEPLTKEEQARIPTNVCYVPGVLDSPILRAPLVRTQLHAALEQPVQMEVKLYWNGLLVQDLSRNVFTFFYMDDVGERDVEAGLCTPEGRVAANFRQMFTTFLTKFPGIMVHSSGAIRGQRAALFLAPDAGGKTTVLRHSRDALLLSDDQIILREEADDIIAHGTPFGTMTSGPCHARLGGLFVLDKADHFDLSPLKPAELVKLLWDEHKTYTSILPKRLRTQAFELFHDVCHRVPIYRMQFPKDRVDWDAIDAAMVG